MAATAFFCPTCRTHLTGVNASTNITFPPSPAVAHLLGTNKVPSIAECREIQESMAAIQPTITQLEGNIAQVQRVLERLVEERNRLKEYENQHSLLLTPARRMPVDIWSEIFSHCLPQGDNSLDKDSNAALLSFDPRRAPALLLQVCRGWRDIALSSPRLWTSITLNFQCIKVPLSVAQRWLSRSHQAVLEVKLKPPSSRSDNPSTFMNSHAVQAVFEQSHRWQYASIALSLDFVQTFPRLKSSLPELEELHLDFEGVQPIRDFDRLQELDTFMDTPKLRRVTIYHPSSFLLSNIKLPWEQLTHFSSTDSRSPHNMNMTAFRLLLQFSPQLLEVKWHFASLSLTDSSTLHHARLRHLSMSIPEHAGSAFDVFSLPSLSKLSIATFSWTWNWPSFEPFFAKNCRALESFTLRTGTSSVTGITQCLELMPALCHLNLTVMSKKDGPLMVDVLQELCSMSSHGGPKSPVLLPKMKTIAISCVVSEDRATSVVTIFAEMIKSRWRLGAASHTEIELSDILHVTSTSLRTRDFSSTNPGGFYRSLKLKGWVSKFFYHY